MFRKFQSPLLTFTQSNDNINYSPFFSCSQVARYFLLKCKSFFYAGSNFKFLINKGFYILVLKFASLTSANLIDIIFLNIRLQYNLSSHLPAYYLRRLHIFSNIQMRTFSSYIHVLQLCCYYFILI